jgi:SAM-dependent methyltransferase
MTVDTWIYDEQFFKNTIEFEAASAHSAASILYAEFKPGSVVDIGCGVGLYLAEFGKLGAEILGIEGSEYALPHSFVREKTLIHDLTEPLALGKKFDLALCLEVAEHLPENKADILVDSLAKASDVIVFTAAVPGQGPASIGHINEQLPEYWHQKFLDRGFRHQKALTEKLRQQMIENNVVWWITNNLMIFYNNEK